jgi:cation diffusion facilitator CzcD-associated flavoprotein CzcO
VSNNYLRTFTKEHVDLVTDPIARITPTGVETADGTVREVDVLILATGFRLATDPANYERTPVRGRDGFDLAEFYANNRARSYEGTTPPGLPNHFMMFGPFGFVGGTWHELVEITAAHVIRIVREAQRRGTPEVEVKEEAAERWTAMVREKLEGSLWFHSACDGSNSYYFDRHGDTPYLRPTSSLQARRAGRRVPFDDYIWTEPRVAEPVAGAEEHAAA